MTGRKFQFCSSDILPAGLRSEACVYELAMTSQSIDYLYLAQYLRDDFGVVIEVMKNGAIWHKSRTSSMHLRKHTRISPSSQNTVLS